MQSMEERARGESRASSSQGGDVKGTGNETEVQSLSSFATNMLVFTGLSSK